MKSARCMLALAAMIGASTTSHAAADRSAPPLPGAVPAFTMPVPTELTLKNGLRVYFLERHRAPLVDVVAVIGAGGLADAPGHEGTAMATADLLTQGSGDKNTFTYNNTIKTLNTNISTSTS